MKIIAVMCLAFFCCWENSPTTKSNVYFGDSITEGHSVASNQRWTYLYSVATGVSEDNHGLSGTTITTGLGRTAFDVSNVPVYDSSIHHYIFLAYGTNDIDNGGTSSAYAAAETAAVDGIISKGWPSGSIVLVWTWSMEFTESQHTEWRNALKAVAVSKSTKYLDFSAPLIALPNRNDYEMDNLHPNVSGYALFSSIAQDSIKQFFKIVRRGHKAFLN